MKEYMVREVAKKANFTLIKSVSDVTSGVIDMGVNSYTGQTYFRGKKNRFDFIILSKIESKERRESLW